MKKCDCPKCEGYGSAICPNCNGNGTRYPERPNSLRCSVCNGRGELDCPHCTGEGFIEVVDSEQPEEELAS